MLRDLDVTRGLRDLDRPVFIALGQYDFVVAPPGASDRVRPCFREVTVRVPSAAAGVVPRTME